MMRSTLLMSIVGILVLVGCSKAPESPVEIPVKPAKLIEIQGKPSSRVVQLPALIQASEEAVLTFQVSGLVNTLDLQEGEEVKEGGILAQLDQRDYRNALNSAKADYKQAQSEFERAQRLITEDAIAKSLFDQREAQRNKAKAALDSAQKRYEDTVLRAPYDAIVAKVHIEQFENVTAQQQIVTLLNASGSSAVAQVPASLVIKSATQMPDKVTLELDAAPGMVIPTQMLEAAAKADPGTQTFEVRYVFQPPKDLVILPGMTGTLTGEFQASKIDNTGFKVPLSAVVSEASNTFVWVVDKNTMTVNRRDVSVTPGDGSEVIIAGVEEGEVLVGAGGHYLFEGAKVRPYVR